MARSIFFYTDSRELGGAEFSLLMLLDDDPGTAPLAERATSLGAAVRYVAPMPLGLVGARTGARLARLLRSERPAILHVHMSWPLAGKWALAAAVAARVPSVGTVQLIPDFQLNRSSFWQLRALSRGVGRYAAVSRGVATELAGRFRWPAEKIEVVYNAVRLERFEAPPPEGLRQQLGGGDRPLVLTPARLDEQKGHPVLLRAAAELPGVAFAFAGEGPERGALEALASELGLSERVAFLGYRDDIPALLAACDVFALPSLYEGSSLAVLEAMAARRAIVSSAIRGTDELIEDGRNGLLVTPGDVEGLRAALARVLGDKELREQFARRARERVERDFTQAAMIGTNERIYRELLGDDRPTDA